MDDAERRLQAVAEDAEREVDDVLRQYEDARRDGDTDALPDLRRRLGRASHRRDAARGALDKYRADKRRRN